MRSIVGNFLEHSRIFYCYNDGWEDIYMGSADWMPRNLDKRVEIMFPVEDRGVQKGCEAYSQRPAGRQCQAHILQLDGSYSKIDKRGKVLVNSQEYFCKEAVGEAKGMEEESVQIRRVFEPLLHVDE